MLVVPQFEIPQLTVSTALRHLLVYHRPSAWRPPTHFAPLHGSLARPLALDEDLSLATLAHPLSPGYRLPIRGSSPARKWEYRKIFSLKVLDNWCLHHMAGGVKRV